MKEPHFCQMVQELRKIKMAFSMVTEVASVPTNFSQQIPHEQPKMEQMKEMSNDL